MSRFSKMSTTFKPYFAQMTDAEHENAAKKRGPQRVAFTWAVRHRVTSRASEEDVEEGNARYVGQARSFEKSESIGAPRMEFASGLQYAQWRDNVGCGVSKCLHDDEFVNNDEVPDWMLDLGEEKERRYR